MQINELFFTNGTFRYMGGTNRYNLLGQMGIKVVGQIGTPII